MMRLGWLELRRSKKRFMMIGGVTTLILLLVWMISGLADGLAYDNGSVYRLMPDARFTLEADAKGDVTRSFLTDDAPAGTEKLGAQMVTLETRDGTKTDAAVFALAGGSRYAPKEAARLRKGEVLVDTSLLAEGGAKVGDAVTDFRTKQEFRITGTTPGRYSHAPVLWMTWETWQDWQETIGVSYASAFIGESGKYSLRDVIESVPGYSAEQSSFQMMRLFLVLIGALLLSAFFYLTTMEKLPQLGILKAIGLQNRRMGEALLLQVVFVAAAAAVCSFALALVLKNILPADIPFRLEAGGFLYAGILLASALIGALFPLRLLGRVEPADVIGGVRG